MSVLRLLNKQAQSKKNHIMINVALNAKEICNLQIQTAMYGYEKSRLLLCRISGKIQVAYVSYFPIREVRMYRCVEILGCSGLVI